MKTKKTNEARSKYPLNPGDGKLKTKYVLPVIPIIAKIGDINDTGGAPFGALGNESLIPFYFTRGHRGKRRQILLGRILEVKKNLIQSFRFKIRF